MRVHHVHARYPRTLEEGIKFPASGVTGGCEAPCNSVLKTEPGYSSALSRLLAKFPEATQSDFSDIHPSLTLSPEYRVRPWNLLWMTSSGEQS